MKSMNSYACLILAIVLTGAGCHQDDRAAHYHANPNDPYDVRVSDTVAHGEADRNCFTVKPASPLTPQRP